MARNVLPGSPVAFDLVPNSTSCRLGLDDHVIVTGKFKDPSSGDIFTFEYVDGDITFKKGTDEYEPDDYVATYTKAYEWIRENVETFVNATPSAGLDFLKEKDHIRSRLQATIAPIEAQEKHEEAVKASLKSITGNTYKNLPRIGQKKKIKTIVERVHPEDASQNFGVKNKAWQGPALAPAEQVRLISLAILNDEPDLAKYVKVIAPGGQLQIEILSDLGDLPSAASHPDSIAAQASVLNTPPAPEAPERKAIRELIGDFTGTTPPESNPLPEPATTPRLLLNPGGSYDFPAFQAELELNFTGPGTVDWPSGKPKDELEMVRYAVYKMKPEAAKYFTVEQNTSGEYELVAIKNLNDEAERAEAVSDVRSAVERVLEGADASFQAPTLDDWSDDLERVAERMERDMLTAPQGPIKQLLADMPAWLEYLDARSETKTKEMRFSGAVARYTEDRLAEMNTLLSRTPPDILDQNDIKMLVLTELKKPKGLSIPMTDQEDLVRYFDGPDQPFADHCRNYAVERLKTLMTDAKNKREKAILAGGSPASLKPIEEFWDDVKIEMKANSFISADWDSSVPRGVRVGLNLGTPTPVDVHNRAVESVLHFAKKQRSKIKFKRFSGDEIKHLRFMLDPTNLPSKVQDELYPTGATMSEIERRRKISKFLNASLHRAAEVDRLDESLRLALSSTDIDSLLARNAAGEFSRSESYLLREGRVRRLVSRFNLVNSLKKYNREISHLSADEQDKARILFLRKLLGMDEYLVRVRDDFKDGVSGEIDKTIFKKIIEVLEKDPDIDPFNTSNVLRSNGSLESALAGASYTLKMSDVERLHQTNGPDFIGYGGEAKILFGATKESAWKNIKDRWNVRSLNKKKSANRKQHKRARAVIKQNPDLYKTIENMRADPQNLSDEQIRMHLRDTFMNQFATLDSDGNPLLDAEGKPLSIDSIALDAFIEKALFRNRWAKRGNRIKNAWDHTRNGVMTVHDFVRGKDGSRQRAVTNALGVGLAVGGVALTTIATKKALFTLGNLAIGGLKALPNLIKTTPMHVKKAWDLTYNTGFFEKKEPAENASFGTRMKTHGINFGKSIGNVFWAVGKPIAVPLSVLLALGISSPLHAAGAGLLGRPVETPETHKIAYVDENGQDQVREIPGNQWTYRDKGRLRFVNEFGLLGGADEWAFKGEKQERSTIFGLIPVPKVPEEGSDAFTASDWVQISNLIKKHDVKDRWDELKQTHPTQHFIDRVLTLVGEIGNDQESFLEIATAVFDLWGHELNGPQFLAVKAAGFLFLRGKAKEVEKRGEKDAEEAEETNEKELRAEVESFSTAREHARVELEKAKKKKTSIRRKLAAATDPVDKEDLTDELQEVKALVDAASDRLRSSNKSYIEKKQALNAMVEEHPYKHFGATLLLETNPVDLKARLGRATRKDLILNAPILGYQRADYDAYRGLFTTSPSELAITDQMHMKDQVRKLFGLDEDPSPKILEEKVKSLKRNLDAAYPISMRTALPFNEKVIVDALDEFINFFQADGTIDAIYGNNVLRLVDYYSVEAEAERARKKQEKEDIAARKAAAKSARRERINQWWGRGDESKAA